MSWILTHLSMVWTGIAGAVSARGVLCIMISPAGTCRTMCRIYCWSCQIQCGWWLRKPRPSTDVLLCKKNEEPVWYASYHHWPNWPIGSKRKVGYPLLVNPVGGYSYAKHQSLKQLGVSTSLLPRRWNCRNPPQFKTTAIVFANLSQGICGTFVKEIHSQNTYIP